MFFTSWVTNAYMCLLSVFPEEVVRGMIKTVKEVHEKHVIDEARLWHCGHTLLHVSTLNLYTLTIRDFKEKWSKRIPEQRREHLVEFCKNGSNWIVQNFMSVYSGYQGYYPEYRNMTKKEKENIFGINEFLRGIWATWSAWSYEIDWDAPERGDDELRNEVSRWYSGIHEGRYFLFFKENDICKENIKERFDGCNMSMYNLLKYHQIGEDLLTLDGGGIGDKPSKTVEHIDVLIS